MRQMSCVRACGDCKIYCRKKPGAYGRLVIKPVSTAAPQTAAANSSARASPTKKRRLVKEFDAEIYRRIYFGGIQPHLRKTVRAFFKERQFFPTPIVSLRYGPHFAASID